MQRIWVLSELYYPERTSTAYFLTEIAQALASDYDVNVLTRASGFESQHPSSLPSTETVEQVKILRCLGTSFNKNWLPGRLVNGISCTFSIFWKALRYCNSGDTLLVVTNPPLMPLVALLLKILRKIEYVLLVHDVYPEVLAAVGLISSDSILYKLNEILNSWVYQNAQQIITLGRDMLQLTQTKLDNASDGNRIRCISNWAETDSIHPLNKQENPLLKKLGISEKFIVLYAGNMGRTHDVEILLEAATVLQRESSKIHFLFIGTGVKKAVVEATIAQRNLVNVTSLNYLPYEEKNISLNACDVGVISFLPGMSGVSVPSRMYNQMAAGKPLLAITEPDTELARVIQEESIGWHVSPKNLDALLTALREAFSNPAAIEKMGHQAAVAVRKKYTLEQASRSYKSLFGELLPSFEAKL